MQVTCIRQVVPRHCRHPPSSHQHMSCRKAANEDWQTPATFCIKPHIDVCAFTACTSAIVHHVVHRLNSTPASRSAWLAKSHWAGLVMPLLPLLQTYCIVLHLFPGIMVTYSCCQFDIVSIDIVSICHFSISLVNLAPHITGKAECHMEQRCAGCEGRSTESMAISRYGA